MRFIYSIICLFTLKVSAQQKMELFIWPQGALFEQSLEAPENVDKNGRITNVSDPTISVYLPKKSNGAAVIICTGGGYGFVTMPAGIDSMAGWLNEQGMAAIFLKYRLPNGNPQVPLGDLEQAMRLVKQKAIEWKINVQKIGVMGFSAGGHLAATLAIHAKEEIKPAFQILLYPVISMDSEIAHKGSLSKLLGSIPDNKQLDIFSLEKQVTPLTPPAFIALSDDDKSVSPLHSIRYYTSLKHKEVPATMHIYPKGGHGWAFRNDVDLAFGWKSALCQWLHMHGILEEKE